MPRAARTVDTTKAVNIAGTTGVTINASPKSNTVASGRLTTLSTGKSRGATHQRGNSAKRYSGSGRKSSGRKSSGRRKGSGGDGGGSLQCCCLLVGLFTYLFECCYDCCCKDTSTEDYNNDQNNIIVNPMVNPNPMVSPVVNPNQGYVPVSQSIIPQQPIVVQPQNGMTQPMMQPMMQPMNEQPMTQPINEQPISNQNDFQPQPDIGFTNNQGVAQIYTN